jgi:hypothetical protein
VRLSRLHAGLLHTAVSIWGCIAPCGTRNIGKWIGGLRFESWWVFFNWPNPYSRTMSSVLIRMQVSAPDKCGKTRMFRAWSSGRALHEHCFALTIHGCEISCLLVSHRERTFSSFLFSEERSSSLFHQSCWQMKHVSAWTAFTTNLASMHGHGLSVSAWEAGMFCQLGLQATSTQFSSYTSFHSYWKMYHWRSQHEFSTKVDMDIFKLISLL